MWRNTLQKDTRLKDCSGASWMSFQTVVGTRASGMNGGRAGPCCGNASRNFPEVRDDFLLCPSIPLPL